MMNRLPLRATSCGWTLALAAPHTHLRPGGRTTNDHHLWLRLRFWWRSPRPSCI